MGSTRQEQKQEAIEINKSLTALGDVIESLTKKQKSVPYRLDVAFTVRSGMTRWILGLNIAL